MFTFGQIKLSSGGKKVCSGGVSKILGFWELLLLLGGGLGLCGSGGPVGVSDKR